jgi:hypothetical protein
MSNSLYDLYLGDVSSLQGYRCRSLVRDSAPLIAPRFSTGSAGQTDLDLLKSASIDSLEGGMFQRVWEDSQKVARARGIFNKYDKSLYPTPPRSSATAGSGGYYPAAKAEAFQNSFIAFGSDSAGPTFFNIIYMVTPTTTPTALTLPAGLASNSQCTITGLCLHKEYLFIASQTPTGSVNCYRYRMDTSTFTDIGMNGFVKFFTLRGTLYGVNRSSQIYIITAEDTATPVATLVTTAGSLDTLVSFNDIKEFNGAAWLAKTDGIYRFDGVNATRVLSLATYELCIFNGALFFFSGLWLYKFDGTNVTRLQFFGNQEVTGQGDKTPYRHASLSLAANNDYLFIGTCVLTGSYSNSDKFSSTAAGLKRIYTYDAVGFLLLHESAETLGINYHPALLVNNLKLYDYFANVDVSSQWAYNYYSFDFTNIFTSAMVTTASGLELTSSEFDDGFPNIFKSVELIEANYAGLIVGDSLAVNYQTYDGKTWSSWVTAGTITSTTINNVEIPPTSQKLFKKIKINFVLTLAAGSTAQIKGCSMRYTLQPRVRWRWQANIMATGNSIAVDRNNNAITADSNALTNSVIRAIKQKTPLYMFSPDYGLVKSQITSAALSFIVKGQAPIYTDPYSEYPLVSVFNNNSVWEILRVSNVTYNSGLDETTITVLERGYLGVTPGQINANAEFHLCYKVYATRLIREQASLDDKTYNEQTSGESQLQREFMLEIIEV